MRVAILLGGNSPERDVSLESGRCVAQALMELGHMVVARDPARGSDPLPQDTNSWGRGPAPEPPKMISPGGRYYGTLFSTVEACRAREIEVIFNALHGGIGEDGTIQGYLDLVGIPYTGSGMLASALAMDKTLSKKMFAHEGVRTPLGQTFFPGQLQETTALAHQLYRDLGLPVVVKPNNQGSTVGLRLVREESALPEAFAEAARFGGGVLIEEYIPGRELTVAILEDRALPIVEIVPEGGLYDYTAKYTEGKSQYVINPDLPNDVAAEIQDTSLRAFNALGCSGYARADLRLTPEGVPYVLEINTLPGMTTHSLVPKAAKAAGIEFPQLVEKIISLAVKKHRG